MRNARLCKDKFTTEVDNLVIKREREKFWRFGQKASDRKKRFAEALASMICVDSTKMETSIQWRVNGSCVCKSFYREVCAISTKMFDSEVASILVESKKVEENIIEFKATHNRAELSVLTFVDVYFKGKNVENAPDAVGANAGARFMRMKWKDLFHKHYVPVAMHEAVEVDYNLFCAIRLRLRPNYKRHRKSRSSKKWSHLECPDCTHLRNGITKATCASTKTFEKSAAEIDRLIEAKRNLVEKLDQHYTAVNGNHEHYAKTIHKAIVDKDFDISINVDAAGTIVMNHGVYYMENLAGGEPLLYKCLKTKNTFVYVHGFGTFVYQSYPEYEKQGANLTTEIIFRIVKKVLKIRGLQTFRNLMFIWIIIA